ncbi:Uu.00g083470.m01.CDS01 [Anthostomella pinea]|uniref:Uu.00g083470.m01.CDS01 n=1 Tax=Anthostomella pinea TaxID=933095 RepID=A0AAI8VLJ1_9PEZI|nr:Uu.00g083470.m01.CDS01 [Anthostomella pinea]
MKLHLLLLQLALFSGATFARRGYHEVAPAPPSSALAPVPLSTTITGPQPTGSVNGTGAPTGAGPGANCGLGYTYCGYMLSQQGHDFAPSDVSKAYCSGLGELCAGSKPKTDPDQAVYLCMDKQPSSIMLACACSGKCLNEAETKNIAHCDKPCVNA